MWMNCLLAEREEDDVEVLRVRFSFLEVLDLASAGFMFV